jgi:asparagine synthase (glutamine-hydrolysing)
MCGITGYWFRKQAPTQARAWLEAAVTSLNHRGPDDRGIWMENGIGFGHARLSILDLSAHGHQPMISRNGDWVMVFNGEVYNFREIRHELESLGHTFVGSGDSEVILEAFAEWGPEAVQGFIGMFAIALWSRLEKKLYLIRDRLGVKPLYYGWDGDALWFGSELKALRSFRHWQPKIDSNALADYFRYGYISDPLSIYQTVSKLQPGCWLELGEFTEPAITRYWDATATIGTRLHRSEDELEAELETLLVDAFRYRLIADVPVGVFLSGGIDSSIVAAILQKHGGQRIKTFTIGFDQPEFNEAPHAEAVAKHLGTEHTTRILKVDEAMRILPDWGNLYDEPFGDASGIPTLMVSRVAAESVKVVLSADGGDELFSGYTGFTAMLNRMRKLNTIPRWARQGGSLALSVFNWDRLDNALADSRWPAEVNHRFRYAVTVPLRKIRNVLKTNGMGEMYDQALAFWSPGELQRLIGSGSKATRSNCDIYPGSDGERLSYWCLEHYLPSDILTKVDRATMAVSIEGREPLLDHRLVEFATSIPFSLRQGSLGPKHLLRKVLYKYVPRELIDRPKMGFSVPLEDWLRGGLIDLLDQYLDPTLVSRQGVLDPGMVAQVLARFRSGDGLSRNKVWLILAFQMWYVRWMDEVEGQME